MFPMFDKSGDSSKTPIKSGETLNKHYMQGVVDGLSYRGFGEREIYYTMVSMGFKKESIEQFVRKDG